MASNTRSSRLRRVEQTLEARGASMPSNGDNEELLQLEQLVIAARSALQMTERMAAMPFAARARGCAPPVSAHRIFGDAAMHTQLERARRDLAAAEADLAAWRQARS